MRHDTTRRDVTWQNIFYDFDMLKFTVADYRRVTARTDKDCCLDWKKICRLSLPVDVNARWLLSCRVVPCRIM
jgi:hypothetical protein